MIQSDHPHSIRKKLSLLVSPWIRGVSAHLHHPSKYIPCQGLLYK